MVGKALCTGVSVASDDFQRLQIKYVRFKAFGGSLVFCC